MVTANDEGLGGDFEVFGLKLDKAWKRIVFFFLGLAAIPFAVFIAGFLAGALWRFFLWGFNILG